ncbi:hypothetical protein [Streptomyces sp. NPDC055752]
MAEPFREIPKLREGLERDIDFPNAAASVCEEAGFADYVISGKARPTIPNPALKAGEAMPVIEEMGRDRPSN